MRQRPLAPWVVCLACFDVTTVILGFVGPSHHWWFWLEVAAPNVVLLAVVMRRRAARARRVLAALEREYDRMAAPLGAGRNGHHSSTVKSARRR